MPTARSSAAPETAGAMPDRAASSRAVAAAPERAAPAAPARAGRPASLARAPAPPVGALAETHLGKPCPGLADCPERPRLVRRLYDAAEREIAHVEASLGGPSATAARRLGALAATLDRLAALDRKAMAARDHAGDAHAAAVAAPVDAEAWAETLAAQLEPGKAGDAGGAG
ncbi:MAG: hypothetical protein JNK84_06635 [Phreatobacter sp.]|uniref:hypothetical protein n=1 Tax=Phreatobacter sp. TaxID=1966341 RepID=UPI001A53D700|nr:hypothetical protein [Phreatobacter sp.]MBL8568746.1 hypothetical protein [Phreatobacter sp.]